MEAGNLIAFSAFASQSSALFESNVYIWKFSVHLLLKPSWRILNITLLHVKWVQMYGSLNILWRCLSLELEWKLSFSSPVTAAELSKFAGILSTPL